MRYTGVSTLVLEKFAQDGSWSLIDAIGSVNEGKPGNKPANPYGWTCDNVPDMNGTMARSSTNSSLLIRKNGVISGANAVSFNTDDFKTLSSEWMAMALPKMEVDEIKEQRMHIVELMKFMAEYDYDDYYKSSGPEEELLATSLNDSKVRFSVSVNDYAGREVSLFAKKDNLAFYVDLNLPVVVGAEMSAEGLNYTDSELFQMRNCDVVVMSGAVLNHTAQNTVNLKNVHILPGAELNIADNNTLQIDRLNIYANNNGTPEVKNYEGLKSLYPMKYLREFMPGSSCFISLPYNVAMNDIMLANGRLGVVGGSWRVKRYDGMFRSEYGVDVAGKASAWVELSRNDTIKAGVGYLFESDVQGDGMFVFIDSENRGYTPDGLVRVSRNRYHTSSDNRNSGWNLIGVPYISSFNGALVDVSQSNPIPYISVADGNNGDFRQDFTEDIILPPLSCLFVQAVDDADVMLDNTKLELSPYKSVSLRLMLNKDNVEADRTVITIDENAPEKEYKIGRDLEKISNYGAKSRIYTIDHGGRLAVNALPSMMIENIPVGAYFEMAGIYTISLDETKKGYYKYVTLTDKKTNKRVNLRNAAYVFAIGDSGQDDDRFLLSISDTSTKQNAIEDNSESAYYKDGKICLSNLSGKAAISIYDAVGRTLVPEFEHSDSVCYIDGLPSGIYFIRVRYYADEAVSLKVVCY
jgi:hypothetical protein